MRPTWLIEADVFGEAAEPLKAEIRRQGMVCHVVRHQTLFGSRDGSVVDGQTLADDGCVISYGSSPLMRHIPLHRSWVPGGWCSVDKLACSAYYAQFEGAVRLAVSLGGDADTLACIAGGIAQAYYGGVPGPIREPALWRRDDRLRGVVEEFEARYPQAR